MTSKEIDSKINAVADPLSTQSEMLIQSLRELNERSLALSTEGNVVHNGQRFNNALEQQNFHKL